MGGGKVGRITADGRIARVPAARRRRLPGRDHQRAGRHVASPRPAGTRPTGSTASGTSPGSPLPGADSLPGGITRGPDGDVWYADRTGLIGRISATGTVTVFPVPDGADKVPMGLTAGPGPAVLVHGTARQRRRPGPGRRRVRPGPSGRDGRLAVTVPAGPRADPRSTRGRGRVGVPRSSPRHHLPRRSPEAGTARMSPEARSAAWLVVTAGPLL
ncbi:hypothetical protein GCM10017687_06720 [Streptomyces echinatus]